MLVCSLNSYSTMALTGGGFLLNDEVPVRIIHLAAAVNFASVNPETEIQSKTNVHKYSTLPHSTITNPHTVSHT